MINLRPECESDRGAIAAVITAAFAEAEHSGGNEAQIVERLRADGDLSVSLVAIEGREIVGHVAVSRVVIDGKDRRFGHWFGLGPVSVLPIRQKEGIGAMLIDLALETVAAKGAYGCVVLGDPEYYRRFGFRAGLGPTFPGAPDDFFMALPMAGRVPEGETRYAPAFYQAHSAATS